MVLGSCLKFCSRFQFGIAVNNNKAVYYLLTRFALPVSTHRQTTMNADYSKLMVNGDLDYTQCMP